MRYMDAVMNIYKPQGMTPLQAINAVREMRPEYRNEKMTYAGRLDPMAEGVLVILVGDAVHEKETYGKLDKTYEADVLFGIGTDTYDLLGMPIITRGSILSGERMEKELRGMRGAHEYPFPAYSSKPVDGKPLFQWAREGKLHEIKVPKRLMRVYEIELRDRYVMTADAVRAMVMERIARVTGDFRQRDIGNAWNVMGDGSFQVARITLRCASGTYVRTIAHEWGKRLQTDAVLLRLVRKSVGSHGIEESIRV